jgi:hypothetical protein
MNWEDWKRGSTRYVKLRQALKESFAPAELTGFCIAVPHRGGLARALNPFAVLQHEYVFASTESIVVVYQVRLPGIFGARLGEEIAKFPKDGAGLSWNGKALCIQGKPYYPLPFHRQDAEEVPKS